jgi:serine/threonine-protein kinase RsbW
VQGHADHVAVEPEHWAVRAEPSQVCVARTRVGALARRAGMLEPAVRDVELGVSEAVSNAVLHAFTGRREPGTIELAVQVVDDAIVVVVTDDGSGLRPRHDSPGAGFGLTLIRRLTRTLTVTRPPGGGLSLRMAFPLALRHTTPERLGRAVPR